MKEIPIFSGMPRDYQIDIILNASFIDYNRGDKVYVNGDPCDSVYFVTNGRFL